MQYGNLNVDEKYSSLVEPNLYSDNILEPGVTYNEDSRGMRTVDWSRSTNRNQMVQQMQRRQLAISRIRKLRMS